jgi:CRP/FNR family transcriptional regulator, cyclic AMP receptor protein
VQERRLTDAEWATIRRLGRLVRYSQGQRLCSEGDDDARVFAIQTGEVRVTLNVLSGAERVVGVRRAGELVGEMAALDGSLRSASMEARDPTVVYVLTESKFHEFLRLHPEASYDLLMVLARRLRDLTVQHAVRSEELSSRVVWRLTQLAEETGETRLKLTQQELADWIGATREATARVLRGLRDTDVLTTGRGWIELRDPPAVAVHHRRGS